MKQEDTEKIIKLLEEIKQELKNLSEKLDSINRVGYIPNEYPYNDYYYMSVNSRV